MKVIVKDEEVTFNLFKAMKHSKDKGICFQIDATKEAMVEIEKQLQNPDPLEQALTCTHGLISTKEEQEIRERIKELNVLKEIPLEETSVKILKNDIKIDILKPKLKTLSSHLKYVFLEEDDNKPIIINNSISS